MDVLHLLRELFILLCSMIITGWIFTKYVKPEPPPQVTSPSGGEIWTSEDGRVFTASGNGHTYELNGRCGIPNCVFSVTGHNVNVIAAGIGWIVNTYGDEVNITASGIVINVVSTGKWTTCIATGIAIRFSAFGDYARCVSKGYDVTFMAKGNHATYIDDGLGFTFENGESDPLPKHQINHVGDWQLV